MFVYIFKSNGLFGLSFFGPDSAVCSSLTPPSMTFYVEYPEKIFI